MEMGGQSREARRGGARPPRRGRQGCGAEGMWAASWTPPQACERDPLFVFELKLLGHRVFPPCFRLRSPTPSLPPSHESW